MKWNCNQISKFLEIYQNFPVLWDIKSKDYLNTKLKDTQFKLLFDELKTADLLGDMDVKQLKNKIKTIKDVYRKEIAKMVRSKKSGQGTDYVYVPKLAWFGNAAFLREVISIRETQSNLEIIQSSEESLELDELNSSSNDSQLESLEAASTSTKRSPEKMKPPSMPARKKKTQSPSPIDQSLEKFSKIVEKVQTEDSFDHFGRYVGAELRQLPQRSAIKLQFEIQKLIMEAKLSELRERECGDNISVYIPSSPSTGGTESNSPNVHYYITTTAENDSRTRDILEEAVSVSFIDKDD